MESSEDNKLEEDDNARDSSSQSSQDEEEGSKTKRKDEIESSGPRLSSIRNINVILCVLVVLVSFVWMAVGNKSKIEPKPDINTLLDNLKKNYPHQDVKLWSTFEGQVMDFITADSIAPFVFVMVYNNAANTVKLLASEISSSAVRLKHNNDNCGDEDLHKLTGSDPRMRKGYMLEKYLSLIKRCKKMIMYNIEELPGGAASDLHSLLDRDYPNFHDAVYVFTLKAPDNSEANIYEMVTGILSSRWGLELDSDTFTPIISRLINFVKILPEPDFDAA